MRIRRAADRIIGIEDPVEREAMRDQSGRIEVLRLHGFQQHGFGNGVRQPYRDLNVLRSQPLQAQIDFGSVHADVADEAARSYNVLAEHEIGGALAGSDVLDF
jgi:hypothetical protein